MVCLPIATSSGNDAILGTASKRRRKIHSQNVSLESILTIKSLHSSFTFKTTKEKKEKKKPTIRVKIRSVLI